MAQLEDTNLAKGGNLEHIWNKIDATTNPMDMEGTLKEL